MLVCLFTIRTFEYRKRLNKKVMKTLKSKNNTTLFLCEFTGEYEVHSGKVITYSGTDLSKADYHFNFDVNNIEYN